MLLAGLLLVPAIAGAAAWARVSSRTRIALLLLAGVFHLLGTARLWWSREHAGLGSWLQADAAGLIVLTVVSLVFFAVALHAAGFLAREPERGARTFVACLLAFLTSATVVALAHHLALLWIGMEATTLSLAPLVFYRQDRRSLEAVWKYLLLSSVGIALALLGTFFLAAAQVGGHPLVLEDLVRGAATLEPRLLRAAFVFLLVGYGTKMGLAPLHSWKPDTYGEAPDPVSALMAGALTSCAFLGLLRVTAVMVAAGEAAFIRPPLFALGIASLVVSAGFMIGQTDLKRLLAYSSVEHMGILAIGLGVGGAGSYGAMLHLVNNGLMKGAMFLAVGNVVALSGTAEAGATRGLLARAPLTAMFLLAGLFALTGSPPFGFFISELTILGAAFRAGLIWLVVAMLLLFAIVFIGMARLLLGVAYGDPGAGAPSLREAFPNVGGFLGLGTLVLMLGLWIPGPLQALLVAAAQGLGGGKP